LTLVLGWNTGIRNALLNALSADELRPDIGSIRENRVIAKWPNTTHYRVRPVTGFFWRSLIFLLKGANPDKYTAGIYMSTK
jgi:hypothetical protein